MITGTKTIFDKKVEKFITVILISLFFILPVCVFGSGILALNFVKNNLLLGIVSVAAGLAVALAIKQTKLPWSRSPVAFAGLLLLVVYAVSAVQGGSWRTSFLGAGAEITTVSVLLVSLTFTTLIAVFIKHTKSIKLALTLFLVAVSLVYGFELIKLFWPQGLASLPLPTSKLFNSIGSWSDLGIFSGLVLLLTLLKLENPVTTSWLKRGYLYVILFISLFFCLLAPFHFSWWVLALWSGGIWLKSWLTVPVGKEVRQAPSIKLISPAFLVALLAVAGIFFGAKVNVVLFEALAIPPVQTITPSWAGTRQVVQGVGVEGWEQKLLGVGPNQFNLAWQQYRPADINYTPWWGADFIDGVATLPASVVTVGWAGAGAWLFFIITFLGAGFKSWHKVVESGRKADEALFATVFLLAIYSWLVLGFNAVGVVPWACAFMFTGLTFSVLAANGAPLIYTYSYQKEPQKGFTIVVISLLVMVGFMVLAHHSVQRVQAQFLYQDALKLASEDETIATKQINQAVALAPSDVYYRTLAQLQIAKLARVLQQANLTPAEAPDLIANAFNTALLYAQKARDFDTKNYQNWLVLGDVHVAVLRLGIESLVADAATEAQSAYAEAIRLNPSNPYLSLQLARAYFLNNQLTEAAAQVEQTIALKQDYPEVYLLKSKVEVERDNLPVALEAVNTAQSLASTNPEVSFQLGYVQYKLADYSAAIATLETVLQAVPEYTNVKYFLGLAYAKNNQFPEALQQFSAIAQAYPEREDIRLIIVNLEAGKAPLESLIITTSDSLIGE